MAQLNINGRTHNVDVEPDTPLLWVIREHVGLTGTKYGCGVAQCGACSVHLNGEVVRSCAIPVSAVQGRAITTLEGLMVDGKPGRVQQAFIDAQAVQCGYCTNGMVMASAALLAKNRNPSDAQINEALDGNLCRCGTQQRICAAVKRAAQAA
jgi:aerobic-type carbon monoxide dehydrogenase small subunit (CoxS/CutS family)